MDRCLAALSTADVFAAIGTSGAVYPAAGFVEVAQHADAHIVELNLAASDRSDAFAERRLGPANHRAGLGLGDYRGPAAAGGR